jgi:hypothetical protein
MIIDCFFKVNVAYATLQMKKSLIINIQYLLTKQDSEIMRFCRKGGFDGFYYEPGGL